MAPTYKNLISSEKLPRHVAIIMDGNGRWARSKGEERTFGHRSAIDAVRNAINACNEVGIPYLTLYTFSTENWQRPADEVDTLMSLLSETLLYEADHMFSKGLKLHTIGDISRLPAQVQEHIESIKNYTKNGTRGNLILALNYGAQREILNAVREISAKVKSGEISPGDIDEEVFAAHLYTKDFPPVDLLIRTSGEVRVSNFLLWQIAYAEMQFLDVLWPDFTKEDFFKCIVDYQSKERRFGKTSEQLNGTV